MHMIIGGRRTCISFSTARKQPILAVRFPIKFLNSGVMVPPLDQLTADGYDLQFGTNVLGHSYFTTLLVPILLSTAKSTPSGHVRVVNTSSSAVYLSGRNKVINWDSLGRGEAAQKARKKLGDQALYAQSKCVS